MATEITPGLVRDLRERTGAGLMDCKRALEATKGDLEQAIDHLRKQGLRSAEKKADRAMGEGRVLACIAPDQRKGSLVAVTCETDFVARTEAFEDFLQGLAEHVLSHGTRDVDSLLTQTWKPTGRTVGEALKETVGKLGENMQIARVACFGNDEGRVGAYVHHNQKLGVLASVTTQAAPERAAEVLKELCMHAAAMKPQAARREDVPEETLARERGIYLEEVKDRPAEMREKIVAGKLEKFFADAILGEQKWFKDDSKTVAKALVEMLGAGTRIEGFARFEVGG